MTNDRVLVVDLDGTLIRTDMLVETFWSAFSSNWATPFHALASLAQGKVALKQCLLKMSDIDVTSIPPNTDVVAYVQRWRSLGGRTVLVTASHQALAEKIAAHYGLFDEVHGSNGSTNLKGGDKAAFLEEHFGEKGFDYIGDARADLPVWEKAAKAITVNLPRSLRKEVEALGCKTEHIGTSGRSFAPFVQALRPHQWVKNLLVFAPMVLAHQLVGEALWNSILAFISFCLIASNVYVVNDLLDLSADRRHPRKRNRPLASGRLSAIEGTLLAPILFIMGFAIAISLGPTFILVMVGYYAMTTAYSLYLKRRLVIDICTLAGLYTVRIIAGGAATGIELSVWLLAFSIFIFLALAAIKRQSELVDGLMSGRTMAMGRGYHVDDRYLIMSMATSSSYISVLVMSLYLNSPAVMKLYEFPPILWGICPILLYWLSRMLMVTHRGNMHDDPIIFAAKDHISILCLFLMLGLVAAGALL